MTKTPFIIAFLFLAVPAVASAEAYVDLRTGVHLVDGDVADFAGTERYKLEFDTGYAVIGELGYRHTTGLLQGLRLGLEVGYRENSLKKMIFQGNLRERALDISKYEIIVRDRRGRTFILPFNRATRNTVIDSVAESLVRPKDTKLSSWTLLANAYYHVPFWRIKPYIGGGVGFSHITFDTIRNRLTIYHKKGLSTDSASTTGIAGDDDDIVLAGAFMVGAMIPINKTMQIGLNYQFLGTADATFKEDEKQLKEGGYVRLNGTRQHTISANYIWRF